MEQAELLLLLVAHLALTALPGAAAALLGARLGVRQVPVLLAIGMAATGAVAMLSFWGFYGDPVVGEALSFFVVFGSMLLIGWALYGGRVDPGLLRSLATPLALWALGSAFLLLLGFVHGGMDAPLATGATRFSHALPTDSTIPVFYADWFFQHGHSGAPPVFPGEWLSSDRPPLQVGYVLSQRPFGWDEGDLNYQVLAVALQQLWIVGLWALLVAAGVGRVTRALAMVAVLLSGLAIVNGFFVWPKMLPAAMLLAAAALVLTPLWAQLRNSLWAAALFAALCGLALLGHGASVYGVIALVLVAAFRGLPSWRWLGVAAAVGIVLMAPWSAYQKYGDPPGNRLTKWTLAGVVEIDDRGVLESIRDSYSEAGFDGMIDNKVQNYLAMYGGEQTVEALDHALETGELEEVVRTLRGISFFNLLPSMGLLLIAPVAMAVAWRRCRRNAAEWDLALVCLTAFAAGAIVWGLLAFGNLAARTFIHVGTYLVPLLGICGAVVGLRASFPRFALYFVGLSALLGLAVYAPALDPLPGTAYSPLAIAIAAASLAGFAAVALREDGTPSPAASEAS
ncbi:MAG: hypothetical protein WD810_07895 [Solirubrobacterales bacterium]